MLFNNVIHPYHQRSVHLLPPNSSEMLRISNPPLETTPFHTSRFRKITNESPNFLKQSSSFKTTTNRSTIIRTFTQLNNPILDVVEKQDGDVDQPFPYVQTLSKYPKQKLRDKLVMVRFDAFILIQKRYSTALLTVKYLHEAGAKLILVSDWRRIHFNAKNFVDILQAMLELKVVFVKSVSSGKPIDTVMLENADVILLENLSEFKEEAANCLDFAKLLSSNVDVFVNDAFSVSHKILASTVGVTQFCSSCLAGFHFEECVSQIKNVVKTDKRPFFSIIGGGNIHDKASALHFLAARCDGLIFVGMMAFQIMHALGYSVPLNLIEPGGREVALEIIQFARDRSISITIPRDFWCMKDDLPKLMEAVPADSLVAGWLPVEIGPKSLDEINSLLSECKKCLLIGPVKFKSSVSFQTNGASKLVRLLNMLSTRKCDITIVGQIASQSVLMELNDLISCNMTSYASVAWETFKGRKLHGIMALDKAYPFEIDWNSIYCDPTKPLVVDIGSGNGLFLLGMARKRNDLNFLGIEINGKLVRRCMDVVHQFGFQNGYFIAANATSTFRSIIYSYPGELVLVSIQCPNPDFNNPGHRWRMLQKSLVEAVVDLLAHDGKVFLQSDVEPVAVRMKDLFLNHSNGKLCMWNDEQNAKNSKGMWLEENPFGVRSDWERHVLARGAPMYRLMLSKSEIVGRVLNRSVSD